jgi:hypothetical protein
MSRPIVLWHRDACTTTDDAGTTVVKTVLASPAPPGPYELNPNASSSQQRLARSGVPPLTHFCLRWLADCPEQLHLLGSVRLRYISPQAPSGYDPIRALVGNGYRPEKHKFDWSSVDPRLWATICQVFTSLPDNCFNYKIPLSDKHLPLLQQIPSTQHFSLITLLALPGTSELDDETIVSLKELHTLTALDASHTGLTSHGIGRLARTLNRAEDEQEKRRRGPWALRLIDLRHTGVDSSAILYLQVFPLLSLVGQES